MNLTGVLLVTISCITHSLWNLQAKKKSDQPHFLFWMLVTVSMILAIPSLGISLWRPLPLSFWLYGLAAGFCMGVYFYALSTAYLHGDLSLVYPLARATPLFLLTWTSIVMGVQYDILGYLGIALVVLGTVLLPLFTGSGWKRWLNKGNLWAVLSAIATCGYSLCDKGAMDVIDQTYQPLIDRSANALVYLWFEFSIGAISLLLIYNIIRQTPSSAQWRLHTRGALPVALLNIFTYGLVLYAMMTNEVLYVVGFRQLGILFGVFLGITVLKENQGVVGRIAGAIAITAGLILIALA